MPIDYEELSLLESNAISQEPTLLRVSKSDGIKDIFEPEKEGLATFIKSSKENDYEN